MTQEPLVATALHRCRMYSVVGVPPFRFFPLQASIQAYIPHTAFEEVGTALLSRRRSVEQLDQAMPHGSHSLSLCLFFQLWFSGLLVVLPLVSPQEYPSGHQTRF